MATLIKKVLVKLGLAKKTIAQKIEYGRAVISAMTGNGNFTTPSPTLVDVGKATDKLETAANGAATGDHSKVQEMYNMEFEFDAVITNLGKYVETTANNNAAVITSAGMQTRNSPKNSKVPDQVVGIKATPVVNAQKVKLKWDAVDFALLYFIYQSTSIDREYKLIAQVTGTKFTVEKLTAGSVYYWKIEARNGKGTGTQSDPMSSMAN